MDLLPEEAQDDLMWAVAELNKRERSQADILHDLNGRLLDKGVEPISKSAFNRKSVRLAAMSSRLNEARHIFAGLAPQFTADKVDENTLVLGEFIKLLILEIVQADGAGMDPKGAMELAKAHLAVIQGQKLSAERRAKLQSEFLKGAGDKIDAVAMQRGLSDEVRQDLRRDLFGIAPNAKAA